MKVFKHTGFKGHWPVGTAAVVVAPDVESARFMLEQELVKEGLTQRIEEKDFDEIDLTAFSVHILNDGNY